MTKEAKNWEKEHKAIAQEREISVKMLSQKIIGLEKQKDDDLKNYTVSMRQIEDEAKSTLDDLHSAIESKKTEFEILNTQMALKNR
jgi:DNA/RNA endonuclease G (NUC1)